MREQTDESHTFYDRRPPRPWWTSSRSPSSRKRSRRSTRKLRTKRARFGNPSSTRSTRRITARLVERSSASSRSSAIWPRRGRRTARCEWLPLVSEQSRTLYLGSSLLCLLTCAKRSQIPTAVLRARTGRCRAVGRPTGALRSGQGRPRARLQGRLPRLPLKEGISVWLSTLLLPLI